jgi:hypothetical protein
MGLGPTIEDVITHVVMFTLADSADIDPAIDLLHSMSGRIPGLVHITAGRNQNQGPTAHDVVLITRHTGAAALQSYVKHPVHLEVISWLKPRWTARTVVDTDGLNL